MKYFLAVFALLFCLQALAQDRMEIIPLQNRQADQILPILRPLMKPGESISAMDSKLIVRASPASLAQIRQILASIDTPARRLLISVRQGALSSQDRQAVGASGSAVAVRNGEIAATISGGAISASAGSNTQANQQVQTIEGGEASIFLGSSLPLPFEQAVLGPNGAVINRGVQYLDVGTGFIAKPTISGDRVIVSIRPTMQRLSQQSMGGQVQRIETSQLSTQISGRLGEWINLGGSSIESQAQGSAIGVGVGGISARAGQGSSEVWLKVDALD